MLCASAKNGSATDLLTFVTEEFERYFQHQDGFPAETLPEIEWLEKRLTSQPSQAA